MRFLCVLPVRLSLVLGWSLLAAHPICAQAAEETSPASEVAAALAKLHSTTYRQRDVMTGSFAAMGAAMAPTITEHAGDRTRLISEISAPTLGTMRTERITIGEKSAVRITAPALLAKLEQTKSKLTVSAAKSLLQQIVSAASAVQTGGLSAASWISEATRAALNLKTTAEARVALDRAMAGFQSWQPVVEDDDPSLYPAPPDEPSVDMLVEKTVDATRSLIRYRRTPTAAVAMGVSSVLIVDAKTGWPVAEENFVNGQRMMRSEYFDIGAPITIETPPCLER